MRRLKVGAALVFLLAAPCLRAQDEAGGEGNLEVWAWLNFALLAGGLTWVFRKNAVPFFAARAIGIRKGMVEADEARAEAESRIAAVEARLANLAVEIQAMKDAELAEEKSEHEHVRQETAAELTKIRARAGQEIAAAGKAARVELRRYSAALAVAAAEQKIRARMNPATQDALFRGFVHNLSGATNAPGN